ncbi:hypothetical protein FRC02_004895 [Tulasnella sp. 418]|nr:hypothetical protein FRC02_004895 [Tulasnella sp. 418]
MRQVVRCRLALEKLEQDVSQVSGPGLQEYPEDYEEPHLSAEEEPVMDPYDVEEMGPEYVFDEFLRLSSPPLAPEERGQPDSSISSPIQVDKEPISVYSDEKRACAQAEAEQPPETIDKFPEAGTVIRIDEPLFEDWRRRQTDGNVYHPFKNKLDWEVGKWVKQHGPGNTALDKLLAFPTILERLDLSFKNTRQLNQIIDNELPEIASWLSVKMRLENSDEEYDVYYRNPLDCIKGLYGNPAFADKMVFAPERHWTDSERKSRIYNEMYAGDWWWRKQNEVKTPGATIILVIVGTDKSQLTVFSGGKEVYPAYLTIGNIPKNIRRKLSHHAQLLFAYIRKKALGYVALHSPNRRHSTHRLIPFM